MGYITLNSHYANRHNGYVCSNCRVILTEPAHGVQIESRAPDVLMIQISFCLLLLHSTTQAPVLSAASGLIS